MGEPFRFADVLINPQGPLPQVLLRMWTAVAGAGDLALRSWAAAGGVLGLALAAWAYRRVRPQAALAATWLLAVSPFHIWYSQEVRNYIWLLAASVLVLGTLIGALDRPSVRAWIGHALSLAALLLCNLSAVFLFPAIGIWVLIDRRRSFPAWLAAAIVALAAASPWLMREYGGHLHWAAVSGEPADPSVRGGLTFHPGALPFTFAAFVGGFGLGPPLRDLHGTIDFAEFLPHLPWLVPAALATLTLLAAAAGRLSQPRIRLCFWWAFLPALLVAGIGLIGLKAFNPRYVAASQPVFLLLLAEGLVVLWRRRRAAAGAAGLLLIVPMLVALGRQSLDPRYGREDYRGAASFLEGVAGPDDLLLQEGVAGALDRYYRGPARVDLFEPRAFLAPDGGSADVDSLLAGHPRVWWVGSRLWFVDPDHRLLDMLRERGRPLDRWDGAGVAVRGFDLEAGAP